MSVLKKDYRLTNNLINNQNYIINKKIKQKMIFDFLLKKVTDYFLLKLVLTFIKKFILFLYKISFFKKYKIFLFIVIHILLIFFCLPLFFIHFLLYIIFYIWFSITIVNTFYDYYLVDVYILGFRNYNDDRYSYNEELVELFKFKGNILGNDGYIWLEMFYYTLFSHVIFIILYFLI